MNLIIVIILALLVLWILFTCVRIVPQNEAFVIERLGKFRTTLESGLHLLIPFLDKVAYKHTLKEQVIDVPPQVCITKDNISVEVDGVLYIKVMSPKDASYGVTNYHFAAIQISQTTMRSVIGKLEMDRTFEEREAINYEIINAVDKASAPWGVKVQRYEVKNITPPQSIKDSMEQYMRAERERRAVIAESEGARQSQINRAEGEKIAKINVAEGQAAEINLVANATADALIRVAEAINHTGGTDAVALRIAEGYLKEFGKLAKTNNTMIVPANVIDIATVIGVGKNILESNKK